jgi:hypothetical protein
MVQLREQLRLALVSREALLVGDECRGQDLDRDVAFQAGIVSAIHLAHAALAQLGGDLVGAEAGAGRDGHSSSAIQTSPSVPVSDQVNQRSSRLTPTLTPVE